MIGFEYWKEFFSNATITDCAVRDRNIIYVAARELNSHKDTSFSRDHDFPTNMCAIYLDDPPDQNVYGWRIKNLSHPKLGVSILPASLGLLVSRGMPNAVVVMGLDADPQEILDPDNPISINRVKTVLEHAYAVGGRRQLYKRTGAGQWEQLWKFSEVGDLAQLGFNDVDAFDESDIYAVGGKGDAWHFNGTDWRKIDFPSNVALGTVTCAEDGFVYITGEGGAIWKGRDSAWHQCYEGKSTVLWNDAIWFQGQLWLSSDYRLRIWDGKTLVVPLDAEGHQILMSGHMDARDGILAIASTDTVMTFDGKEWRVIVEPLE